ncbi:MAG: helix-turn-helix domain-containing protein [Actinobacteria bacterium]|nr:helix-turn-helix domain-containing protein [Actinomycetota bacterium]
MPENMTTAEVAELCRVSEVTVRWWRHVGRGPRALVIPGGRRVLYRRQDVESWLVSGLAEESPVPLAGTR